MPSLAHQLFGRTRAAVRPAAARTRADRECGRSFEAWDSGQQRVRHTIPASGMTLPRHLAGADHARALGKVGYRVTRRTGSHVRLTTDLPTQHHLTIAAHDPLRVGTPAAPLADMAQHLEPERDELLWRLFG